MSNKNKNKNKNKDVENPILAALKTAPLTEENIKLQDEIRKKIEDNEILKNRFYEIKEKIKNTINEKKEIVQKLQENCYFENERLDKLNENLQEEQKEYERKKLNLETEKETDLKSLEEGFQSSLFTLNKKIDEMNLKLIDYGNIKKKEKEYLTKIEDLEHRIEKSEFDHHDKMREAEKNFAKQDNNIKSIHKAKIDKILKNASTTAQKNVLEQEEKTEFQNQTLMNEMKNYHKNLENLKLGKKTVSEENKIFNRNLTLAEDEIDQYHNVNTDQNRKIKKLKDKIEFLKNYISQEVIKYTKEIELTKFRHQSLKKEYEYQLNILKDHIKEQSSHQKKIRKLADKILEQRSDIEEYFLNTIDQPKNTSIINKTNMDNSKSIEKNSILNSKLNDKNSIQDHNKDNTHNSLQESNRKQEIHNAKVDISDLSFEDREKILRILFAKINAGRKPLGWKIIGKTLDEITEKDEDNKKVLKNLDDNSINKSSNILKNENLFSISNEEQITNQIVEN